MIIIQEVVFASHNFLISTPHLLSERKNSGLNPQSSFPKERADKVFLSELFRSSSRKAFACLFVHGHVFKVSLHLNLCSSVLDFYFLTFLANKIYLTEQIYLLLLPPLLSSLSFPILFTPFS